MRIPNEHITLVLKHIRKWLADCAKADYVPEKGVQIENLCDTIKALQQEVEKLKTCCKDMKWYVSNAELRIKENERLKAEIQLMKYYLTDFVHQEDCCSDTCACETEYEVLQCGVRKALSATPADYHNPADVKLLEKTKQALLAVFRENPTQESMEYAESVLAEIKKAVGE